MHIETKHIKKWLYFHLNFNLNVNLDLKCFLLDIILNQYCMFAAGWVIDEQIYSAWVRLSLITVVPSYTVTPLGAILTWHLVLWCSFVSISTVRYPELSLKGMAWVWSRECIHLTYLITPYQEMKARYGYLSSLTSIHVFDIEMNKVKDKILKHMFSIKKWGRQRHFQVRPF